MPIDLAKRNDLIRRYCPELLNPAEGQPERRRHRGGVSLDTTPVSKLGDRPLIVELEDGEIVIALARLAPFLTVSSSITPLLLEPLNFIDMTPEAVATALEEARRPRPVPTVSVDEFFDGNDQPTSIGPGLSDDAGLFGTIRDTLAAILARAEVHDVRIGIDEWPNPLRADDNDEWPVADAVYIWTAAPMKQVREWTAPLRADGLGLIKWKPLLRGAGAAALPAGVRTYAVRWD